MLLRAEDDRLILQTRATPAVLAALPRLEGHRRWLKDGRLSVERTPHNHAVLASIPGVTVDVPPVVEVPLAPDWATPVYLSKTSSYPHQDRALAKLKTQKAFGLFMEQGTGKTKVLLDWAGDLFCRGLITGVLVVSKKGVHRQWAEGEMPKHLGVDYSTCFWPINSMPPADKAKLEFFTINYDGMKTVAGFMMCSAFGLRHKGKLLIIADESQEIKNKKSERWKTISELKAYSSHRALATGTPIARDLTDEWAQLSWLDEKILGIRYVTAFRAEFCVMGGFEGRVIIAHKNVDEFKRRTEPYIFRATKDEIGILPKQYSEWTFDLTKPQRAMLVSLKQELEAELASGKIVTAQNAAVTLVKMQQVSSGFIIDGDNNVHRLMEPMENPRVRAAVEWYMGNSGKAVIWVRFREDVSILRAALDHLKIKYVTYFGDTSDKDRADAVRSFLDQRSEIDVFLANPQSAGTGLNLQGTCQRALYYSNSFNAIDRWQSEDRIHRIGTVGSVVYTDLIAKGSIDRHIARNLLRKKGLSSLVLDDIKEILGDVEAGNEA